MSDPRLVAVGWILATILWQTTIVAVLLVAWRGLFPRAAARVQHLAASLAFAVAVGTALATPLLLRALPEAPAAGAQGGGAAVEAIDAAQQPAAAVAALPSWPPAIGVDLVAASLGIVWAFGVLVLWLRLAGSLGTVAAVRRRAVPLTTGDLYALAQRVRSECGLTRPMDVLASTDVDAPAVVGWRKPALIIPTHRLSLLSTGMVAGLFAHELAHVRRRDYLVNLLQSMVEALLFFSPALTWIGRCVRETREYCCDDEAIGRGADRHAYVLALTALASGATLSASRAAMSATGPRLVVRVRRLLSAEPAPRRSATTALLSAGVLVVLVVSGGEVLRASAARMSRLDAMQTPLGVFPYPPVPYSYNSEPFGGALAMDQLTSTLEAPVERVRIHNRGSKRIVGLRFAAAVEHMGSRRRPVILPTPVRLFYSTMHQVSIAPGAVVPLAPRVLAGAALQAIVAEAGGAHVQFYATVIEVEYEDGTRRQGRVNPLAVTGRSALVSSASGARWPHSDAGAIARGWQGRIASLLEPRTRPNATISRGLLGVPSAGGSSACRDERDRAYSAGAIVGLRDEPARKARCDGGRWLEMPAR